jgi:hypothetical protein
MSKIPICKDLDAYLEFHLEPHNVIPITPFSIESVIRPPFQIFSPHLGADRHNQPLFIHCQRHADSRCGQSLLNPATQRTCKRTTNINYKTETDTVRIGIFFENFLPTGRHADSRCGQCLLNPVIQRTSKRTIKLIPR